MLFTLLQEEQARQAKQIQGLESERAAQELLLQEKGAQIKVTKSFSSCQREKISSDLIITSAIKVLEGENLALAALLGNLKDQLSQVA